jgi:guanylate kinase
VLVVIAGPSGVGKGTLIRALVEQDPRLWVSISATTRAKREAERHGREYWFLSPEAFDAEAAAGEFLEQFEVYDARYGTPRAPIEQHVAAGDDVVFELDVQGARAIRAAYPDALLIFVAPPSRAVQRERLLGRDPQADRAGLERRLDQAETEEREAADFDAVVVNDDLSRAVAEVAAIVNARRTRSEPA